MRTGWGEMLVAPLLLQAVDAGVCDPNCIFALDGSDCDCGCGGEWHAAARGGLASLRTQRGKRTRYMKEGGVFYDCCPKCYEVSLPGSVQTVDSTRGGWRAAFVCWNCDAAWDCWYAIPASQLTLMEETAAAV